MANVGVVIPRDLIEVSTGVYRFNFEYTYPDGNGGVVFNNNPVAPTASSFNPPGGWEKLLAEALKVTALQESNIELDYVVVPDLRLHAV